MQQSLALRFSAHRPGLASFLDAHRFGHTGWLVELRYPKKTWHIPTNNGRELNLMRSRNRRRNGGHRSNSCSNVAILRRCGVLPVGNGS
jgi:hypothetical protein